jgi:hypothetical protein
MFRWIVVLLLCTGPIIFAAYSGCHCGGPAPLPDLETTTVPAKTIEQVLNEHTNEWMAIPGVVGTAIGQSRGKPCILIFTSLNPAELSSKIASTIGGYPVLIEQTGDIRALEQQ